MAAACQQFAQSVDSKQLATKRPAYTSKDAPTIHFHGTAGAFFISSHLSLSCASGFGVTASLCELAHRPASAFRERLQSLKGRALPSPTRTPFRAAAGPGRWPRCLGPACAGDGLRRARISENFGLAFEWNSSKAPSLQRMGRNPHFSSKLPFLMISTPSTLTEMSSIQMLPFWASSTMSKAVVVASGGIIPLNWIFCQKGKSGGTGSLTPGTLLLSLS